MSKFYHLTVILSLAILISGCSLITSENPITVKQQSESDIALINAQTVYHEAKLNGTDLSAGPCLSNHLQGDPARPETVWVLDIAHNPRQAIDDLPANQCSAFREGKAKHFIELDENGQAIKTY